MFCRKLIPALEMCQLKICPFEPCLSCWLAVVFAAPRWGFGEENSSPPLSSLLCIVQLHSLCWETVTQQETFLLSFFFIFKC